MTSQKRSRLVSFRQLLGDWSDLFPWGNAPTLEASGKLPGIERDEIKTALPDDPEYVNQIFSEPFNKNDYEAKKNRNDYLRLTYRFLICNFLLLMTIVLDFGIINTPHTRYIAWLLPLQVIFSFIGVISLLKNERAKSFDRWCCHKIRVALLQKEYLKYLDGSSPYHYFYPYRQSTLQMRARLANDYWADLGRSRVYLVIAEAAGYIFLLQLLPVPLITLVVIIGANLALSYILIILTLAAVLLALLGEFIRLMAYQIVLTEYLASSIVLPAEESEKFSVQPIFGSPLTKRDDLQVGLFIIMPLAEVFRPVYENAILAAAANCNITCKRGDDFFSSAEIMDEVWSAIVGSELCIADCTGRNPNVFYELGIAHTLGRPCILIAQSVHDIPFDIQHRRAIIYENSDDGIQKCRSALEKSIETELAASRHRLIRDDGGDLDPKR